MTQPPRADDPHPLKWLTVVIAVGGVVWAGGASYQRLVSLEQWRFATQGSQFSVSDAAQLETRIDAELDRLRSEMENQVRSERTFSRSLCFAISHLQEADGLPITNDCTRP